MESYVQQNKDRMKDIRWKNMAESLVAMRKDGCVDVTLVCGDKEFGAHRLILEASSPYFLRMFRSGMEEAKTGRVILNSMEPSTLESVLNYIYSGEIDMITTEQQASDVLAAAHMMELSALSQFCFEALSSLISKDNCEVVWNISTLYNCETLKVTALEFALEHFKELQARNLFLEISDTNWKELLTFAVSKQRCLDELLKGVLDWLRHDFSQRKVFAAELIGCFDAKFLSFNCLKEFLHDKSLMALSPDIANKMNELGVAMVFLSDDDSLHGMIRFVVGNFSEVSTTIYSSTKVIQNLPWNIFIKFDDTVGKKKTVGFYVQCNPSSKEKSWSCNAKIEYRLVSYNEHVKSLVRTAEHLFCSDENDWGFRNFITLNDESDFQRKYLAGDIAVFEAEITVEAPRGICDYEGLGFYVKEYNLEQTVWDL